VRSAAKRHWAWFPLLVLRLFPANTTPPILHIHIYFSVDLISRKTGEVWEFSKEVNFKK